MDKMPLDRDNPPTIGEFREIMSQAAGAADDHSDLNMHVCNGVRRILDTGLAAHQSLQGVAPRTLKMG